MHLCWCICTGAIGCRHFCAGDFARALFYFLVLFVLVRLCTDALCTGAFCTGAFSTGALVLVLSFKIN